MRYEAGDVSGPCHLILSNGEPWKDVEGRGVGSNQHFRKLRAAIKREIIRHDRGCQDPREKDEAGPWVGLGRAGTSCGEGRGGRAGRW